MTRDEILNMPAGKEICGLVATKVMGWELYEATSLDDRPRVYWRDPETKHARMVRTWYPDEYMDDTWVVIQRMHKLGYQYTLRGYFMGTEQHIATFDHQDWADANPLYRATAETAPLAIARAALLATMESESGEHNA